MITQVLSPRATWNICSAHVRVCQNMAQEWSQGKRLLTVCLGRRIGHLLRKKLEKHTQPLTTGIPNHRGPWSLWWWAGQEDSPASCSQGWFWGSSVFVHRNLIWQAWKSFLVYHFRVFICLFFVVIVVFSSKCSVFLVSKQHCSKTSHKFF